MDANILISWITLAVGLLMLLGSLWYTIAKVKSYRASVSATGTVKGLKQSGSVFVNSEDDMLFREEENMHKGAAYAPVIEFQDAQGQSIEFTGAGSSPPRYRPGDKVKILYPRDNSHRAVIDSFFNKWFLVVFLVAFSAMFVLTGVLLLWLLPAA